MDGMDGMDGLDGWDGWMDTGFLEEPSNFRNLLKLALILFHMQCCIVSSSVGHLPFVFIIATLIN